MSYPAVCRAYSRSIKELLDLVKTLQNSGIDMDAILEGIDKDQHDATLLLINNNQNYVSLRKAAENWKGYYVNMKEEEAEWYEMNRVDSDFDKNEPLYGGISDDWEEYLDAIHHEQCND
eukprot:gene16361-22299_t